MQWTKNSLRIGGRRSLESNRDSISETSQLADSCLGVSVGQAGFKNGELWQMDTEKNETQSPPSPV